MLFMSRQNFQFSFAKAMLGAPNCDTLVDQTNALKLELLDDN